MVGTDRCCLATSLATYRNIPEIMAGVRFSQEKKRILYIRVREPADCNVVSCSSLTHHCYKKEVVPVISSSYSLEKKLTHLMLEFMFSFILIR
jgi:hypothetical protein